MIQRTSSQVRVELADRVLRYTVTETFRNRGGMIGEADYIFPMPAGAAFEALELEIDGELVAGETMPADKARQIYEDIVRRHRDPALVEYMGRGMLRTRVFPIQPGEEKRVVVRFQTVAEREGSALRVDYLRGSGPRAQPVPVPMPRRVPLPAPTPRRGTVEGDEPSSVRASSQGHAESGNLFTLAYTARAEYGRPYSPTHELRVAERGNRREVTAIGDGPQVTILVPVRRATSASVAMLPHAPGREDGFALITVTPPAVAARATSRDLTFVVDVSGSMRGQKMEQARAAGRQLLASLGPQDRFRIVDFSTDVRTFARGFTPATRRNIDDAFRYLDDLRPEGSTNISGALEEALEAPVDDERMPVVFFVTDGEPTVGERNADRIAELAARLRGRARVFTFGVGADVNAALVEQLALDGRGTAQFVRPNESVERAVSLVATRITSPIVTDVRVRAEGVRLTKLHPSLPTDIFAGQDLVLFARYSGDGDGRIIVEGRTVNGPVTWTERVRFPERERGNAFVARLWAAQRAGWLSAERRRHGASRELDDELRELGTRYGIPTELSSYLVLEPGMQVAQGRRVAAPSADTAAVQVFRGSKSEARRMADAGAVRLEEVVTTSGATAAPAEIREREFEAAKVAAAQRAATTLSAADASGADLSGARGAAVHRIGTRTFTLTAGNWTDTRHTSSMRTVRVKPYSAAYFALLERFDELRTPFALMGTDGAPGVIVAGRAVAIAVATDGVEKLSDRELASLAGAW
ncbi:MAG TPA: VIT domain-containing protein [Gemmatimonadaceae bacterium]|nr:VIT domain-containing protein [Gemmatimonadaceae bacterium]